MRACRELVTRRCHDGISRGERRGRAGAGTGSSLRHAPVAWQGSASDTEVGEMAGRSSGSTARDGGLRSEAELIIAITALLVIAIVTAASAR